MLHHQPSKPHSQTRVEKMRMRAEGLPGSSEMQRSIQQHLFGRGGQRGGVGHSCDAPLTPRHSKSGQSHTGVGADAYVPAAHLRGRRLGYARVLGMYRVRSRSLL